METRILRFDSVGSTNDVAINHARQGAAEGLCVVSLEQTKGRGRYGRQWTSPKGSGLYFTAVLRPKFEPSRFPLITLAAAVAVHDTLGEFGLDPDIKWPNDLLVRGKKICGILAETVETPSGTAVVVGIGINLNRNALPPELSETATSVEAETGSCPEREAFLGSLVKYFFFHYERLGEHGGASQVVKDWSARSTFASGRSVRAAVGDRIVEGITDGIDDRGALRIRTEDGIQTIEAGEVSLLR